MRWLILFAALAAAPLPAQIVSPLTRPSVDTSNLATKAELAGKADASAVAAMAATIPTPAIVMPPGVADSGTLGTQTGVYALANHTHASKARKARVLVPAAGFLDVTFKDAQGANAPFSAIPVCATTAETTAGDTNVVNAQIDGQPTVTGMRIRVTRTAITVASLLGLSILSVPTQVATYAHFVCLEP